MTEPLCNKQKLITVSLRKLALTKFALLFFSADMINFVLESQVVECSMESSMQILYYEELPCINALCHVKITSGRELVFDRSV